MIWHTPTLLNFINISLFYHEILRCLNTKRSDDNSERVTYDNSKRWPFSCYLGIYRILNWTSSFTELLEQPNYLQLKQLGIIIELCQRAYCECFVPEQKAKTIRILDTDKMNK